MRELQGLRAEIKQLEADLVVARASEQKGSGGAPGKEEIKELQRQLKLEKRQRMQLEEEAAARATNVVVAPTPAAVRNPDFEGVQAELKLARERIVLLTAQIESLKEESDTYRLRMNQVERELKLAAEKTTKCKKCELNGSESALDEADRIKAERTLRDRITALERVSAHFRFPSCLNIDETLKFAGKDDVGRRSHSWPEERSSAQEEERHTLLNGQHGSIERARRARGIGDDV